MVLHKKLQQQKNDQSEPNYDFYIYTIAFNGLRSL